MKTNFTKILFFVSCLLNFYPIFSQTPLNGTYIIGSNGNYPTFTAAVSSLIANGVSGPVVFRVKTGIYNEQISIPEIQGASKSSTITFESESGDSTAVTLCFSANINNSYTLQLNGADYFIFQKMNLTTLNNFYFSGIVIDIRNNSNHNTFSNCVLQGDSTSNCIVYSYDSSKDEFNNFRNNRILYGCFGFLYESVSSSVLEKGTIIENNIFKYQDILAISARYQDSLVIRNNTIDSINPYSIEYSNGIVCYTCNNYLKIEKNRIYVPNGGSGILLNDCQAANSSQGLISNNFIQLNGLSICYGISVFNSNCKRIYNNNIVIINIHAGSSSLCVENSSIIDIKNNTLANTGGGYALYVSSPGQIITSDYNNLYTTGSNLAYWLENKATLKDIQLSGGQDIHSISLDPLFVSNTDLHVREGSLNEAGISIAEIPDDIDGEPRDPLKPDIGADEFNIFQTDAGLFSLESPQKPFLPGDRDVIVILKNNGTDTLKTVAIDWAIKGIQQTRAHWSGILPSGDTTYVKLGTYSFNPSVVYMIKSWTTLPNNKPDLMNRNDTIQVNLYSALEGIYTIGGNNPDFQNFKSAVTALKQVGVARNVIFKVRNGTYTEHICIPEIQGASKNSTITFESEFGDSVAVVLNYYPTFDGGNFDNNNYTLQLDGADFITFRKMTIATLNTSMGNVIDIRNGSNFNTFSNCIMLGINGSTIIYSYIYNDSLKDEFNSFKNNRIVGGTSGIACYGASSSNLEKGNIIENNIFENQNTTPINCGYQDSLIIKKNTIISNSLLDFSFGISCLNCNNDLKIEKNKIYIVAGDGGISIDRCEGTSSSQSFISNNFIQVGRKSRYATSKCGINVHSSSYQKIYNNNIKYNDQDGSAFFINDYNDYKSNNIDIRNNVFANMGGGYALYVSNSNLNQINKSDYNDLYTTGPNLAFWSGNKATLTDLQLASGKDVHSISTDPLFVSTTDLHVRQVLLNRAGTPLLEVLDDIDGEPRDPLKPDIGADEFTAINPLPSITSFAPTSGVVGTTVTITGANFNTTPANNIVFFGATQAVVSAASATSLTVTVPMGATYQPISVTNFATGLTAYATQPFITTFAGGNAFDANSFAAPVDVTTGTNPMSASICDLDGDGKPDLAVVNSKISTVSVFKNISTSGTVSFADKVDYVTGLLPVSISTGDLNGDGKPDLVVTSTGTASVFRNTSTNGAISFANKVDCATGSLPVSVSIGDLDGDGKPDLAVANSKSNTVSVFRNTSTSGAISFAAKMDYMVSKGPVSVSISDLDGDDKPDLAVANIIGIISVFRNTSANGTISFAFKSDFMAETGLCGLSIGDLDGDSKPDLAVINVIANTVSVYRNTSASGTISFAAKVDYVTGTDPASISIGDLDGDSKPDLAVANDGSNTVSVYRNTSTNGTVSFVSKVDYETGTRPLIISIGDLDGDGKPDLAVPNYSSNTVSTLRNTIMPPPAITFLTPTSGAVGTTVTLTGVNFTGATAVNFGSAAAASFTVNSDMNITATITAGTSGNVKVTTPYGADSSKYIITFRAGNYSIISATALNNITADKPTMYPNPTSGLIMLDVPEGIVTITDIRGMVLHKAILNDNKTIDLGSYPSGMYILKLKTNDSIYEYKVLKQ